MAVDINVITENLAELLTNTVNMTSIFYDIFLNPTPMDVELKQFNKDGELISVVIPNRAKDRSISLSGVGSPEGVVSANVGTSYVDTASSAVYFKSHGEGPEGWSVVLTQEGVQSYVRTYLADNNFMTKNSLETYLVNNEYINGTKLHEALETFTPSVYMNEAPSKGSIILKDNSGYYLTTTGDISFILPTITDFSRLHSITVQLNMPEAVNVELGTNLYFDKLAPSFSEAGSYNIIYEYDNALKAWVVGVMIKGA